MSSGREGGRYLKRERESGVIFSAVNRERGAAVIRVRDLIF